MPSGIISTMRKPTVNARFLASLWHRHILGKNRRRIITRDDIRYNIPWGTFARKLVNGDVEMNELNYLINQIRTINARVFIDIGAHMGWYALHIAKRDICREIYAIEGSTQTFSSLRENVAVNSFGKKITPICAACSDASRHAVYFQTPGFNYSGAGLEDAGNRVFHRRMIEHEVTTTTLDDILSFQNEYIALKIDVEGHERRLLQGAQNILRQNHVLLQIEILPENAAHLNELVAAGFKFLARFGSNFFLKNF